MKHAAMKHAPKSKDNRPRVSFEHLVRKVERAEDVLEMREQRLVERYRQLGSSWRESWTPVRIIAVGLASGFLVGRAEPLRALTGARMLQMVGALSGLFASAKATLAAEQAEEAADTAADTAEDVAAGQGQEGQADDPSARGDNPAQSSYVRPASRASGTPDPVFESQPRAAEAATEISER